MAGRTIFVGGLAEQTTIEALRAMLSQFGAIEDARLFRRSASPDDRGFAYVTFHSSDAAMHARRLLNGVEFQGARLRVDYAR
ncbi:MAG: RNA-binding protein [Myxococcales bacterium]|nr:RNA-binding protein [Myxococcales bacterium]